VAAGKELAKQQATDVWEVRGGTLGCVRNPRYLTLSPHARAAACSENTMCCRIDWMGEVVEVGAEVVKTGLSAKKSQ